MLLKIKEETLQKGMGFQLNTDDLQKIMTVPTTPDYFSLKKVQQNNLQLMKIDESINNSRVSTF